ncbi:MAG: hypothetical protein OEV87_13340, partial [Phycisphaerae bacterium]|nr:hypothetical protein [Phycisphaerae bacterium]
MKLRIIKIVLIMSVLLFCANTEADSIYVANYSFEHPTPEFVYPYLIMDVDDWFELDNDLLNSANTGVFLNVTSIANVDGNQLGVLGGELGNAFLQDLSASYQVGNSYRMTVGVCLPEDPYFQPKDPNKLALSFYYGDPVSDPNNYCATASQAPADLATDALTDYSVYLPTVQPEDAWAGQIIGIAIRATGPMGGYWDVDNVRVTEYPLVPNFTDDSIVNFADFAKMAADWLY